MTKLFWLVVLFAIGGVLPAGTTVAQPLVLPNNNMRLFLLAPAQPVKRANPYTSSLKNVLSAELHYVQKVCEPSDSQFEDIHRFGLIVIGELSKAYADLQSRRAPANQWPAPRKQITEAFLKYIQKGMPGEVAERYEREIKARFAALEEAKVGVALDLIDSQVFLDSEQREQIGKMFLEKWDPEWSNANLTLSFPSSALLPDAEAMRTQLSSVQQQIWLSRRSTKVSRFSWSLHLGTSNLFASAKLPLFPEPPPLAAEESSK